MNSIYENPIKIGIVGHGRMGQSIESQAIASGIEVAWIIKNSTDWQTIDFSGKKPDVVIEFTKPAVAFENISRLIEAGLPVISGTTGWYERLSEVEARVLAMDGTFMYASNFSIGVNILFELNNMLSRFTDKFPEFKPDITETHHIHKIDAPSGTATSLVNGICNNNAHYTGWYLKENFIDKIETSIPIECIRESEVFGVHQVNWKSEDDHIWIGHEAYSRMGFTKGVLLAARWISGRKGIFTMRDVLMDIIKAE